MAELQDDIMVEDMGGFQQDPEPKLSEAHRRKLDSIIVDIYNKGATKEEIQTIVDDYKKKYATKPLVTPQQQQPEKKPAAQSTGLNVGNLFPNLKKDFPQAGTPIEPNKPGQISGLINRPKALAKASEANKKIINEIHTNDDVIEHQIRQQRFDVAGQQQGAPASETQNTGMRIFQEPTTKPQDEPVTAENINEVKLAAEADGAAARKVLQNIIDRKPEKKRDIQHSVYLVDAVRDAGDNDKRLHKILNNAKEIEKGGLVYSVRNGMLIRPQGVIGSLITGWQQKSKAFDDFSFLDSKTPQEIIDEYEKRRIEYDPDEPIPVPKHKLGEISQMLGGMPFTSLIAGGLTSVAGAPEAAPVVSGVVGAADFYKMRFAGTFGNVYNQLRDEGKTPEESFKAAYAQAQKEATVDAAVGGLVSFGGMRLGTKPLAFSSGYKAAATSLIKEGGLQSVIGGSGELLKNKLAQAAGIKRDVGENVLDVMEGNFFMTLGIGALAKLGAGIPKIKYRAIQNGLKNVDESVIENHLNSELSAGRMTEQQVNNVRSELKSYKELDSQIPANITEEARLNIQKKLEKRNELEGQLETLNKAFHPEIKEKIAKIDEDIAELSKQREPKEKQDPKIKEAKLLIDDAVNEGVMSDVYASMAKSDPEGFMKFVADQSFGRTAEGVVHEAGGAEGQMREQFGDAVVDHAKEMFPLKIKQDETAVVAEESGMGAKPNEAKPETTEAVAIPEQEQSVGDVSNVPETTTDRPTPDPEKIGITHEEMDKLARELGLDEYQQDPETITQWDAQARERMAKDPDAINKLIQKLRNAQGVDKVETRMMIMHMADLKARYNKNPTPELLAEIKRTKDLYNISGREKGKELVARKGIVPVEESLADFHMTDTEFNRAPLTEDQAARSTKEFEEISAAKKALEEKVAKLESEKAKAKAEKKVKDESAKSKKGEKKDYKAERQQILADIKKHWNESKGQASATFVPYAEQLIRIAPDVAKLMRNIVEEGITKLPDVIKAIHDQVRDIIPEVTERDIHNIIAGEYAAEKPKRSKVSEKVYDLKTEAKLINKLEALESGPLPKNEKQRVKRNREIEDLRSKIKGISEYDDYYTNRTKADNQRIAAERDRQLKRVTELTEKLEQLRNNTLPDKKGVKKDTPEIEALKTEVAKEKQRIATEQRAASKNELSEYKKRVNSQIKKLEEQLKKGDFAPEEKPQIVLDEEGKKLRDKLLELRAQRDIRLMQLDYENTKGMEKLAREANSYLNISRQLKSTGDVSMPFRQALVAVADKTLSVPFEIKDGKLTFTNFKDQKQLVKAFGDMYSSLAKESVYRRVMADIKESRWFEIAQEAGLNLEDPNSPFAEARGEFMYPSKLEKVPVAKQVVGASNRAASAFVNVMKWNKFVEFAEMFEKQGMSMKNSPEAYKEAAIYANQTVGRGHLGPKLEMANWLTSRLFFSLRLQASRLQLLTKFANPKFYKQVPKEVRVAYMKDMIKTLALGTGVLMTASALGVSVELDPRSSEFGKVKVGDTVYDVWGGFQQYIVLLSRMLAGATKSPETGKINELGNERFGQKNRGDVLLKFLRSKASPELGTAWNIVTGQRLDYEPVTLQGEALDFVTPLIFSDTWDAYKDGGVQRALITMLLTGHGVGVVTYDEKEEKQDDGRGRRETRENRPKRETRKR